MNNPFTVDILHAGVHYAVPCRQSESLLHAIRRANIPGVPTGCGGGGCGVCKVRILQGSVHKKRMSCAHITPRDLETGIALACCVRPQSDIELKMCGVDENCRIIINND